MPGAFSLLQYILPHHALSRFVGACAALRWRPAKNLLIGAFMRGYRPDLADAAQPDPFAYPSFNAFFTRALREGARPLAGGEDVAVSPVDGRVNQAGPIAADRLLQAKGHDYTLEALLAGAAPGWAGRFRNGAFATLYLAPINYHRIHMPAAGTLREAWYVPGRLFNVGLAASRDIPGLFARNERVVLLFDGAAGPFALIFVGALNVGSMDTVWHGNVAPRRPRRVQRLPLPEDRPLHLPRGAEAGRFNMGSTVIVLFGPGQVELEPTLTTGEPIRMGTALARFTTPR
ncbi:MAG: archaetidylserine decarboxylase [Steroidobacteraceae bacterium]